MVAKQQQHTKEKNVVEYFQLRQNKSTTAVAVRSHKSDDAFQSYHQGNPYLKDAVRCLDKDVKVGALRLSGYLAKYHKDEFIDAANASGVAVTGVLNTTESAALYTEAGLGDEQWNTIMRHLRNKFDAKIACSLLDLKRKSYEGYTMPRVKVIYHRFLSYAVGVKCSISSTPRNHLQRTRINLRATWLMRLQSTAL